MYKLFKTVNIKDITHILADDPDMNSVIQHINQKGDVYQIYLDVQKNYNSEIYKKILAVYNYNISLASIRFNKIQDIFMHAMDRLAFDITQTTLFKPTSNDRVKNVEDPLPSPPLPRNNENVNNHIHSTKKRIIGSHSLSTINEDEEVNNFYILNEYIDKLIEKKRKAILKEKRIQRGISLVAGFLFLPVFSWSLIDHCNPTNNLRNNKTYIDIGIALAVMVAICCVVMFKLENNKTEKDNNKNHIASMFGISFALIGCIALILTLANQPIAHYHLSFEAPACFIAAIVSFAIGHATNLAKSKRSRIVGSVAFLIQTVGALALLSEAINDKVTKIMLGVAILGVVLMIGNTLLDEKKVISTLRCFSCRH